MKNHWQELGCSPSTRPLVNWNLKFGYRRAPNLRDILVHAKVYTVRGPTNRPLCKRPNKCKYCPLLDKSGRIRNHVKLRFETMRKICCQSNNIIYALQCRETKNFYVGQTKRKIMTRVYEHLSDIRKNKDTTVARHFNLLGHRFDPPLKVFILEFIKCHPESARAAIWRNESELAWMIRLNSFIPNGLNLQEGRTSGQ